MTMVFNLWHFKMFKKAIILISPPIIFSVILKDVYSTKKKAASQISSALNGPFYANSPTELLLTIP